MNYHELGINVKDGVYSSPRERDAIDSIPDAESEAIYASEQWAFWNLTAPEVVANYSYKDVQAEGRSNGWLVPLPVKYDENGDEIAPPEALADALDDAIVCHRREFIRRCNAVRECLETYPAEV